MLISSYNFYNKTKAMVYCRLHRSAPCALCMTDSTTISNSHHLGHDATNNTHRGLVCARQCNDVVHCNSINMFPYGQLCTNIISTKLAVQRLHICQFVHQSTSYILLDARQQSILPATGGDWSTVTPLRMATTNTHFI